MYAEADEADEPRRKQLKVVLQALAGLLVIAGVGLGLYLYHDRYGISSEERFDRELVEDKRISLALMPLRENYPYEYKRLRKESAEEYNLEKGHGRVIDHLPPEFLKGFLKRHAFEALKGEDRETLEFMAALNTLYIGIDKDQPLCHMMFGNEDQMSDLALVFSTERFSKMFGAFVRLAASGRNREVMRDSATPADYAAFQREARKIEPKPEPFKAGDTDWYCRRASVTSKAFGALSRDQQLRLMSVTLQMWR